MVDLRGDDGCGLGIIMALKRKRLDARAIVYVKPADAEDVSTLLTSEGREVGPPKHPMSADRVRWEHIQYDYQSCGRNVSEAVRRFNMHRRSLHGFPAKGILHDIANNKDSESGR